MAQKQCVPRWLQAFLLPFSATLGDASTAAKVGVWDAAELSDEDGPVVGAASPLLRCTAEGERHPGWWVWG